MNNSHSLPIVSIDYDQIEHEKQAANLKKNMVEAAISTQSRYLLYILLGKLE